MGEDDIPNTSAWEQQDWNETKQENKIACDEERMWKEIKCIEVKDCPTSWSYIPAK